MINKNNNASYNNVIDALKCVAISHGMVNNVSSGSVDEVDLSANSVFPLVHIVPGNVTAGVQQITFDFNILAMDLVKVRDNNEYDVVAALKVNDSNEQQVLSDTMQILIDIIAQYKNGLMLGVQQNTSIYGQTDDKDFTLEPFTERFDNVVSGFNCSFSITVPSTYFACNSFNWSAVIGASGWDFTDIGATNCTVFTNTPKEDSPVVMPAEQTVVESP
tara:strand:- start:277 stop:930 length:654 start_codon:yes stop_codon:yes gene_type:complete